MNGLRQPATSQAAVPGTVAVPKHPVSALTTFELRDYRRLLERAIEHSAETLAPALFSAAERQTIREGIASLKHEIAVLNRRLELVR